MIFIWGKKKSTTLLGLVADFCPVCHDVAVFELREARVVGHFYYIPLGRGTPAGHEIRCRTCGVEMTAKAEDYGGLGKDGSVDARTLLAGASARVLDGVQGRRELDRRARLKTLGAEDRARLIEEPFRLLNPRLEARGASTHFDKQSGLTFLAVVVVGTALSTIQDHLHGPLVDDCGMLNMVLIILGMIFFFYSIATDVKRFARRRLEPALVRALTPFAPTPEELAKLFAKLKGQNLLLAKKLDAGRLSRRIAAG